MNRIRIDSLFTATIAALALPACMTGGSGDELPEVSKFVGNGVPSGPHFDLNIIGVAKGKSPNLDGGNGHRIFVPLSGTAKINLSEGDFAVLDANATDGTGAFQLPNPDPDGDGVTSYSVFARALGTPGGSGTITTCATDPTTGDLVCSSLSTVLVRSKGGSKFTNVSKELLFVVADVDGDGTLDKVPLFDDRLQDFFWSFDNNGLRLAQLRFYDVPTDTN
jgi:hypothetical protein